MHRHSPGKIPEVLGHYADTARAAIIHVIHVTGARTLNASVAQRTLIAREIKKLWRHCRYFIFAVSLFLPSRSVHAQQSALKPASDHAQGIETLWWVMFYGATLIFVAVMLVLAIGLWRARRPDARALSDVASRNLVIAAGVALPLVILIVLVGGSLLLGRSIAAKPPENALSVVVTGWMWWWQVDYLDEEGAVIATTANELHIPVGRPVELQLVSADVIHSFWVPELHGKTDLVPGSTNTSWFSAERSGVYRGQCAEFCGIQHALMAFLVVAEPEQDFKDWLARQAEPAATPDSERARQGQNVFLNAGCADCHTIRGTSADGDVAPDLTHIASRRTLAAATRPNTRGHLGGWISDPQSIKPGNFMPRTRFEPEEFKALLDYLESLR